MRYEELTTEGRNAVLEALRSGKTIDKLFTLDSYQDGPVCTILREAKKYDTIINHVPKERLGQISETGKHQGVIAYTAACEYVEAEDVLKAAEEKGEPPFLILLDGIEDLHNSGAIIRTASLTGAHSVIILKHRAVRLATTVAKTLTGALNYTPIVKVTSLMTTMGGLRKKGIWSVCADMGGKLMYKTNLKGSVGLVVGNEGERVGKLVREYCGVVASIPMKGDTDSLNASVAASVLVYEIVRQHLEMQSSQRKRSDNNMKTAYKLVVKLAAAAATAPFAVGSTRVPVAALTYTKSAGSHILTPIASGITTYSNEEAILDASNVSEGYIMVKYTGSVGKTGVQITKSGSETHTYDLNSNGVCGVFPLSEGSGSYSVKVFENIQGNQYPRVFDQNVSATITNQFEPLLYPSQYVNLSVASVAAQTGTSVATSATDQSEVVSNIYSYVINNVTYDTAKASPIQSSYLPSVGVVLAQGKGTCFDYTALTTATLKSQNISARPVVGYTGNLYHAWINVYLEGQGWMGNITYFDGNSWKLMDPTFTSSSDRSQEVMQCIGNGSNYRAKCGY